MDVIDESITTNDNRYGDRVRVSTCLRCLPGLHLRSTFQRVPLLLGVQKIG